jgi:hypothetical protein
MQDYISMYNTYLSDNELISIVGMIASEKLRRDGIHLYQGVPAGLRNFHLSTKEGYAAAIDQLEEQLDKMGLTLDEYVLYSRYYGLFDSHFFQVTEPGKARVSEYGVRTTVDFLLYLVTGKSNEDMYEAVSILKDQPKWPKDLDVMGLTVNFYQNGNVKIKGWNDDMQRRYLEFMEIRRKVKAV